MIKLFIKKNFLQQSLPLINVPNSYNRWIENYDDNIDIKKIVYRNEALSILKFFFLTVQLIVEKLF